MQYKDQWEEAGYDIWPWGNTAYGVLLIIIFAGVLLLANYPQT